MINRSLVAGAVVTAAVLIGVAGMAQAYPQAPTAASTASASPTPTPEPAATPTPTPDPIPTSTPDAVPTPQETSATFAASVSQPKPGLDFTCSGTPCSAKLGSYVYFGGGLGGDYELWRTDGTNAGTKLVKNISASFPSYPGQFVTVGTWVYFTAASDGVTTQLWRTNGSTTKQVTHLGSASDGTGDPAIANVTKVGSTLYFTATVFPYGNELWKANGTTVTMVADVFVGGGIGSTPTLLTAVGSTLYFVASDTSHGAELWRTKGTPSSTWLIQDLVPDSSSPQITEVASFGGKAYVALKDPNNVFPARGLDVVTSDDRGFKEVNDQLLNTPAHLKPTSAYLLFSAYGNSSGGNELWRTDGTALGTKQVADIAPGNTNSNPSLLVKVGTSTYFLADYPNAAGAIYKTNGTTVALAFTPSTLDGTTGGDTQPTFDHLLGASGKVFFGAWTKAHLFELWDTDGVHVTRLTDLLPNNDYSGYPTPLFTLNGRVFFFTDDSKMWSATY